MGDLVIDVPAEFAVNRQVVRKRAETRRIALDAATRLATVTLPPPDMARPLGDADRLIEAIEAATDYRGLTCDFFQFLPHVQPALIEGARRSVAVHQDTDRPMLIGVWPGMRTVAFGVAFDIGSTTIAGHLVDLTTGRPHGCLGRHRQSANPFRRRPEAPDLLPHDEPRRSRRAHRCRARRDRHAGVAAGWPGRHRRGGHPGSGVRRQSGDAPSVPWHRPDDARPGAVRFGGVRRAAAGGARSRFARSILARAFTCRPASPAMSAPTPPRSRSPTGRSTTTRSRW